ncbi:MAG: type II toxin-antitoxin system VapC family toxin [Chloroflexota bacterium]|nr:type II toxin-antitoxin system VapC family toxin [Chloroflexota bacterium]
MTFFVDANVIIYGAGPTMYGEPGLEVLTAVASGEADGRTSTAVLEEVWYAELSGRIAGLSGLTERALTVFTPLLPVTDEAFRLALALHAPAHLGTNDRLHIGTCRAHGIDTIVSAVSSFDGIRTVRRVDPLDRMAVRRLLG